MRSHLLPFLLPLFLAILFAWLSSAGAQEFVLDSLIDPVALDQDGSALTVTFDDLRSDISDTHYEAQQTTDLTTWVGLLSQDPAVADPSIANRFSITSDDPNTERRFYRILVFTKTATDSDGDGLSDVFEASIGTNPNLTDSDGDGFDDGQEFALDTGPTNATTTPDADLPLVGFTESSFPGMEGGSITLTLDTGTYSGPIGYTTAAEFLSGSADEGVSTALFGSDKDHTLGAPGTPKSTNASNGSATITVPLVDNLEVTPVYRYLFVDILPSDNYRRGANRRTLALIEDDDAFWTGTIGNGNTRKHFRVELLRQGSTVEARFVAGADYDGLTSPEGTATSTSEGVVPEGRHLAPSYSHTDSSLELISPNFALPPPDAGGAAAYAGMFGQTERIFMRKLTLRSDSTTSPNLVELRQIAGVYEETLSAVDAAFLKAEESGEFILIRDISLPPDVITLTDLVN